MKYFVSTTKLKIKFSCKNSYSKVTSKTTKKTIQIYNTKKVTPKEKTLVTNYVLKKHLMVSCTFPSKIDKEKIGNLNKRKFSNKRKFYEQLTTEIFDW